MIAAVGADFLFAVFFIAAAAPLLTGAIALAVTGKKQPKGTAAALLFHSISSCQNTHLSHFSPDKFRQLIGRIKERGIETRTLKEARADGSAAPLAPLVITFDDGFESFFIHALPALDAHGIKATVFPIAGFIGKSSYWDVLPRQSHMNQFQLKTVSQRGHEIGSHTMTHSNLTFLRDEDVRRELLDSKHLLEDLIGKPVTSLSFPYGCWNRRIWEKALEIGYTRATCYRHHSRILSGLVPVHGIYSFDSVNDVMDKISPATGHLNSIARCRIMSHFAKGTPLWKFQKNYALMP